MSFLTFFVWPLLLIAHTWNSSSLRSNILYLQCTAMYKFPQLLEGPMEVLLCERVNDLRHSLFRLLNCLITKVCELRKWPKKHMEQGLDYREGEQLSWCPSCSNSLWQIWSCGLVHCPGSKCKRPDLKSAGLFDGISSLTPLKPHIVTLTPTLTLWPINSGCLTSLLLPHLSSSLTDSLPSLNRLCLSKTDARFMQDGRKEVWSIP